MGDVTERRMEEASQDDRQEYWLQRTRDLNLDPTCALFLKGDPDFTRVSTFAYAWPVISCALFGFTSSIFDMYKTKRPLKAGLPRHIFWSFVGLGVGYYVRKWKVRTNEENDAYYFYYMTLHPEDFRPKEKILFNDYLAGWLPIR